VVAADRLAAKARGFVSQALQGGEEAEGAWGAIVDQKATLDVQFST